MKKSFVITTDTSADLPKAYLEEHQIGCIPLYYMIGDEVYGGERELEPHEFYEIMRKGRMPTTQAVNPAAAEELFSGFLSQGKEVLHIAFSSGISSSYQNAALAAQTVQETYPEGKIVVIDSLSASLGQGLLVAKAVEMKEEGCTLEETEAKIQELIPHVCHQFTVDDLFHLHRGGRVSRGTAIVGTLVNVKPMMHMDDEGTLKAVGKVRGRKKSIHALADAMEKTLGEYKNPYVFISHGDCEEDARYLQKLIEERFGITKALINMVSPTIGAHSGPGTLALFYFGTHR